MEYLENLGESSAQNGVRGGHEAGGAPAYPGRTLGPQAGEGQEPLRDWIYLSVSVFWNSALAPFPLYLEIRNSDWTETFAQIVFQKLAFLLPKKGINCLTGGP